MSVTGRTTERGYGRAWQQLRIEAFALYGDTCHLCGQPGATTIDHLDPLAYNDRGATPTIDRVRPAHQTCNSSRGAKQPPPSPRSRTW